MVQKHFMDIQNLIESTTELRESNAYGFQSGDIIQISEKIDGSNACIAYDSETDALVAFSRKQELSKNNTLRGFWDYAKKLDKTAFAANPSFRVFGEWLVSHKIHYTADNLNGWYVYDIYDTDKEEWLSQDVVKNFCDNAGLNYIHVLYEGPFISWCHCRNFMKTPGYGDEQEGIVVKNQTKLNNPNSRQPFYLKIVNDEFKEKMSVREVDPEKEKAKCEAQILVESIVTKNRIEKELFKMRDEGIIPEKVSPEGMKLVARTLPKRIYEDCIKEDKEIVDKVGEYFGKTCSALTMRYAREVVLGN